MRCLLMDFGASFIKIASFDGNSVLSTQRRASLFNNKDKVTKNEVYDFLNGVLNDYPDYDVVFSCCIMGGGFKQGVYHSWKSSVKDHDGIDLISGLFVDQSSFHEHQDHNFSGDNKVKILGNLFGKTFFSSLADTECVRRSIALCDNEYILNLGTGSQILSKTYTHSFIPSGRSLNVFYNFFKQFGFDMYEYFNQISFDQMKQKKIQFDLNVFPESHLYSDGGCISKIVEGHFTKENFFTSLFACYLDQYVKIFKDLQPSKIYLTGGISKRYPVIKDYLSESLNTDVVLVQDNTDDTIVGLKNIALEVL